MQIKRFEAADMTEALRLVKREFGDDAVILAAKEVKPGGFFSALKKRHVEITAATDYPTQDKTPDKEFTGLLARQLDEISAADRVSLSNPLTPSESVSGKRRPAFGHASLTDDGLAENVQNSRRYAKQPDPSPVEYPGLKAVHRRPGGAYLEKKPSFGERIHPEPQKTDGCTKPFYSRGDRQQIIALVGPPGAGKSNALAKLAWHCRTSGKQHVGLISLDRYRMAANHLLERFAKIMQLPLYVVHDADDLQSALKTLAASDTVLIDTPGMGPGDRSMMAAVRTFLSAARPDETHLVVNATVRKEVLAAAVNTYATLNPDHVLFTHLDEAGYGSSLGEVWGEIGLPGAFFADSVNLYENLKTNEGAHPRSDRKTMTSVGGQVTVFPGKKTAPRIQPEDPLRRTASARFLANRNSELFHEPSCKSVKRINTANIIAFNSLEQALNRGFKPCRACCNVDVIRKMVTEAAVVQRAGAM